MRIMRVGGHNGKDRQISMPYRRQHLKSSSSTHFTCRQQTRNHNRQSHQNNYNSKPKNQFLAHNLLLSKQTPAHAPRFRLALALLQLSVCGNGKKSASCV
jgi:hypothetical protein